MKKSDFGRRCYKCKKVKNIRKFPTDRTRKNGHNYRCYERFF